jgi:hypothetical protein
MKTKDNKKSGSVDRRFCGLRVFHDRWGEPTPKSAEQSENVFENKGQVQKVAESYSARPKAHRAPACPGFAAAVEAAGRGCIALSLMFVAELTAGLWICGTTIRGYFASRDPIWGAVYLVTLGAFAVVPVFAERGRA